MAYVEKNPHPVTGKYRAGFINWRGKPQRFTGTTNPEETLAMAKRFEDDHRQIRLGFATLLGQDQAHDPAVLKRRTPDWPEAQTEGFAQKRGKDEPSTRVHCGVHLPNIHHALSKD